MTGQPTRHDEQRIDANIVALTRVTRGRPLGRDRHAAQPIRVERPVGCLHAAALLDLHESKGAAAPDDEIDLSAGNPRASGEDAPALAPQPPGSNQLRPSAACFGDLAIQPRSLNSRARA